VEDALLEIDAARNRWFENIVPLNEFIEIRKAAARSSLAFSAKRYPGKTIAPDPWIETVLSDDAVRTFERRYAAWREKATNMWHELAARGRTAALAPHDRADVLSLVAEASTLHRTVHWNDIRPAKMVAVSLPTLLAHDPAFAAQIPAEMNALAPVQTHAMLGSGKRIQNNTMTGPDPVLLLQLDSDGWGPASTGGTPELLRSGSPPQISTLAASTSLARRSKATSGLTRERQSRVCEIDDRLFVRVLRRLRR
jgi:hypothetical protein